MDDGGYVFIVDRKKDMILISGYVAYCREALAASKAPRLVQFVDDLPKTSTGKIMRRELYKLDG